MLGVGQRLPPTVELVGSLGAPTHEVNITQALYKSNVVINPRSVVHALRQPSLGKLDAKARQRLGAVFRALSAPLRIVSRRPLRPRRLLAATRPRIPPSEARQASTWRLPRRYSIHALANLVVTTGQQVPIDVEGRLDSSAIWSDAGQGWLTVGSQVVTAVEMYMDLAQRVAVRTRIDPRSATFPSDRNRQPMASRP